MAIIGFVIFANGLGGDFVYDDHIVLSHSYFEKPLVMLKFFGQPYFENFKEAGLYRPLTQISFAVNFLISQSPVVFHVTNVLLHIFNSWLVFILLRKLLGSIRLPLIASLIFMVLPIHVEAVTSIVGRAELLSFFFGLISIIAWLNNRFLLSSFLFLAALFSKETAIVIPIILALLSLARYAAGGYWKLLFYHVSAAIIYLISRIIVLDKYAFQVKAEYVFNPLAHAGFLERVFTALKVLVLYLIKIFLPFRLSADYSFNQIPVIGNILRSPMAIFGLLIMLLLFWIIWKFIKDRKLTVPVLAAIFFVFPYLVISNLIIPVGTIMGERLMYFPSLGAAVILAYLFESLSRRRRAVALAVLAVLLVVYSWLTIKQNRVWASQDILLTDMYHQSPNSVVARTQYGILVINKDPVLAKSLAQSVYDLYPDYIQNLNLMAAVAVTDRDLVSAENYLERALELRPHHQNTMQNLGRVYFTLSKVDKAEWILHELVLRYGGKGNIVFYSVTLVQNGKNEEAINFLNNLFGEDPSDESVLTVINYANANLSNVKPDPKTELDFSNLKKSFYFNQ